MVTNVKKRRRRRGKYNKNSSLAHFLRMKEEIVKSNGSYEFCVSLLIFSPVQTREIGYLSSIYLFSTSLSPISLQPNKL